jgi:hypothetical protein
MIGNVTTNAITPVLTPWVPNYDKVALVTKPVDIPAFLLATTTNFTKSVPDLVDYARAVQAKSATNGSGKLSALHMAYFARRRAIWSDRYP